MRYDQPMTDEGQPTGMFSDERFDEAAGADVELRDGRLGRGRWRLTTRLRGLRQTRDRRAMLSRWTLDAMGSATGRVLIVIGCGVALWAMWH